MGLRFCVLLLQPLLLFSTLVAAAITNPPPAAQLASSSSSPASSLAANNLVRKSCLNASYPQICYRTLSSYGGPAVKTPRDLAQAAVLVSLVRVKKTSEFLSGVRGGSVRERAALKDCVEQMGDAMEELRLSVAELKHLRRGIDFEWQMSNVETWVSAALTNEDTCLDGFKDVSQTVRTDVKRKIRNIAKVTSNALYLINQVGRSPNHKFPHFH